MAHPLRNRFDAQPRAVRWAMLFGAFTLLYFLVEGTVLAWTIRLNERADTLQARLLQEAELVSPESNTGKRVRDAQESFGRVTPPDETPSVGPQALQRLIDGVLRERGVSERTIQESQPDRISGETAERLAAKALGERLQRFVLTVRFEASPEAAVRVVADLERAPEVAAVSRVDLRRMEDGTRRVRAVLVVETWVLSKERS